MQVSYEKMKLMRQFQSKSSVTFYDGVNGTEVPGIFNFTSVRENGTVNIYIRNGDFTGVCDLVVTQGACTWCFGDSECQASVCTYGITGFFVTRESLFM